MTPKVILATPRRLWAHLLCQGCEDRLNGLGENIVLRWLDNNRGFRVLEWMQRSCVVKDEGRVVTFSARDMGINTEPFAHFALGLLWKGAVHKWNTVEGQRCLKSWSAFPRVVSVWRGSRCFSKSC